MAAVSRPGANENLPHIHDTITCANHPGPDENKAIANAITKPVVDKLAKGEGVGSMMPHTITHAGPNK